MSTTTKSARLSRVVPLAYRLASWSNWKDALTWLSYTLFGGLLPFWGTALILWFIGKVQTFGAYLSNGEIAVFCAGLLTSALPTMRRRVRDASVEHPEWLHLAAIVGIAIVLVLFASVTIVRQVAIGAVEPRLLMLNEKAIEFTTALVFVATVVVCFSVELINNVRLSPEDVKALAENQEEDLALKFARARGQNE